MASSRIHRVKRNARRNLIMDIENCSSNKITKDEAISLIVYQESTHLLAVLTVDDVAVNFNKFQNFQNYIFRDLFKLLVNAFHLKIVKFNPDPKYEFTLEDSKKVLENMGDAWLIERVNYLHENLCNNDKVEIPFASHPIRFEEENFGNETTDELKCSFQFDDYINLKKSATEAFLLKNVLRASREMARITSKHPQKVFVIGSYINFPLFICWLQKDFPRAHIEYFNNLSLLSPKLQSSLSVLPIFESLNHIQSQLVLQKLQQQAYARSATAINIQNEPLKTQVEDTASSTSEPSTICQDQRHLPSEPADSKQNGFQMENPNDANDAGLHTASEASNNTEGSADKIIPSTSQHHLQPCAYLVLPSGQMKTLYIISDKKQGDDSILNIPVIQLRN